MPAAIGIQVPSSARAASAWLAHAGQGLWPRARRFRRQFHAWWEGYVLDEPAPRVASPPPDPASNAADVWTAPRIKVAEMVWGDGFAFPGSVDHVIELVTPLGLTPEKSMLYLGAGLGGGPRAIARTFGTWTTGLEASPALAVAGMDYSKRAGLEEKAVIREFDGETLELPEGKFHAICVRHALQGIRSRDRLLSEITKALRPEGHLLISDFAGNAQPAATPDAPEPIELEELVRRIEKRELDVRIAEDSTAELRKLIIKGWADLAVNLTGKSLDPVEARALADELAAWQGRLAAFAAGTLRVVRIHAIKKLA